MNGYTPDTARIRDGYATSAANPEVARREFDAWLAPLERDRERLAQIKAIIHDEKDDDGQAILP